MAILIMSTKSMVKVEDGKEIVAIQELRSNGCCKFSESVGYEILGLILAGVPIREIALRPGMPDYPTISIWCNGYIEGGAAGVLAKHYAGARAARAHQIMDNANELLADLLEASRDPEKAKQISHKHARVAQDSARWMIPMLNPQMYGERVSVHHSGEVTFAAIVQEAEKNRNTLLDRARERAGITAAPVIDYDDSPAVEGEIVDSGDEESST